MYMSIILNTIIKNRKKIILSKNIYRSVDNKEKLEKL